MLFLGGLPFVTREEDLKRGPVPQGAVYPDVSVALFNDAVDSRESEPRSLAAFLRGEEWLKDMCEGLGIHASSRVGHSQHHELPGLGTWMITSVCLVQLHVSRVDLQFAAHRHSVASVDCQIHNDLFDLILVRFHIIEFL